MTPQELRNSILQLAMQGKLVEQRSEEETPDALLRRIKTIQQELLTKKVIKVGKYDKTLPDEFYFEIPETWALVKMGDISTLVTKQTGFDYSKRIKPSLLDHQEDNSLPLIQTRNFKGKSFKMETVYYVPDVVANEYPQLILDRQCLLVSIVGSIGNVGWYCENNKGFLGGAITKIDLVDDCLIEYLFYYLQSPYGQYELQKNEKKTAQATITVEDVRNITIPIPPLAEQKRIIAKIEELLPLIDQYEKAWSKLEDFNKRFPVDMQKSILQMAIQGKLVEQRKDEGTGSDSYASMVECKKALLAQKKIKKEKDLPQIKDEEIPFDIPDSWIWERVGNIGSWSSGATPSRSNPDYYGGSIPWLKTGDLNDGIVSDVPEYITEQALEKTSVRLNPIDSVLMAMYGATIGKLGILATPMTTNQACCACIPFDGMYNKYLFYYLMASRPAFIKMGEGGAQPNISKEKIVNSLIPIPPYAEQIRIVEKLERILPICKSLEI